MNAQQLQALIDALPRHQKRLTVFSSGDGAEWRTWRANFLIIAGINTWGDARQVSELRSSIEGEAARAVADIAPGNNTPLQMLDLYEARFIPAAAAQLARSQVREMDQRPGETLLLFHTNLRELYMRAYPDDVPNINTNRHMIDLFADGITNAAVGKKVIEQQPATYAAALEVAQARQAVEMRYATKPGGAAGIRNLEEAALNLNLNAPNPQVEAVGGYNPGCWVCGDCNHFKRECPQLSKAQTYYNNLAGGQRGWGGSRGGGRGGGDRGRGGRGGGGNRGGGRGGPGRGGGGSSWRAGTRGGGWRGYRGRGGRGRGSVNNLQEGYDSHQPAEEQSQEGETFASDPYGMGN